MEALSSSQGATPTPAAADTPSSPGGIGKLRFQQADLCPQSSAPRSAQFSKGDPRGFMPEQLVSYFKSPSDPSPRFAYMPLNERDSLSSAEPAQQRNRKLDRRIYTDEDDVPAKCARNLLAANANKDFTALKPPFACAMSTPADPLSTSGQIDLLRGAVPNDRIQSDMVNKPGLFTVTYGTHPTGAGQADKINHRGHDYQREDRSVGDHITLSIAGKVESFFMFAVLDGHGGSYYSEHARKALRGALMENLQRFNPDGLTLLGIVNALKQALVQIDESGEPDTQPLQHATEGSTVCLTLIHGDRIYVANLGDSRAIYLTPDETTQLSEDAKPLTSEGTPNQRFRKSVETRGGNFKNDRVNGNLGVTHSVGDHQEKGAVNPRPKVTWIEIPEAANRAGHRIVIVSDGIADYLSTNEMADMVRDGDSKGYTDALNAARLVEAAACKFSTDDLTALVISLNRLQAPPAPLEAPCILRDVNAIIECDRPYENTAIELLPISDEARKAYPGYLARGKFDHFVLGPDGTVRRHPSYTASHLRSGHQPRDEEGNRLKLPHHEIAPDRFFSALPLAFNGNPAHVRARHAEFVLDQQTWTAQFQVNGRAVKSISPDFQIYPLPDMQWMILQPWARSSALACVVTLMAAGQAEHEVIKLVTLVFNDQMLVRGRQQPAKLLEQLSGHKTVIIEGNQRFTVDKFEALQAAIAKNGPCIFTNQENHHRVLHAIRKTEEGSVMLTMGDPYTGGVFECEDHETLWTGVTNEDDGRLLVEPFRSSWSAYFVQREAIPASDPSAPAR